MFEGLIEKVVDFDDDAFRNISAIVEDFFDDLSADPEDRAFGEALVSARKDQEDFESLTIMRPFTYGASLSDSPHAAFPTRFSDGTRFGVWYGSLDLLTSVYETAYHFRRRITDMLTVIAEEVVSERRVFLVHVGGILVDLRNKHHKFPKLLEKVDYSFTHAVGAYLYDNGQNGLLVESARYRDGVNVASFKPGILSNPRHHSYLIYRWMPGDSTMRIEKTRGRTWKVIEV
ncbi:MAG: RES family NAD+ phosphorylase [Nitrospiraceae bacterium]|nr:RES family NAD+ phosphorylase [Nitrospiraceae bacterium]